MELNTPLASILHSQKDDLKTVHWMIVDDCPDVLESLSSLLEGLGRAEIFKFRSAEEALNCFALYPKDFQLVITDLELPQMNGIELCHRMREISPSVKIILSTGNALAGEKAAGEAGFAAVLQKPYTANELRDLVSSVLR